MRTALSTIQITSHFFLCGPNRILLQPISHLFDLQFLYCKTTLFKPFAFIFGFSFIRIDSFHHWSKKTVPFICFTPSICLSPSNFCIWVATTFCSWLGRCCTFCFYFVLESSLNSAWTAYFFKLTFLLNSGINSFWSFFNPQLGGTLPLSPKTISPVKKQSLAELWLVGII